MTTPLFIYTYPLPIHRDNKPSAGKKNEQTTPAPAPSIQRADEHQHSLHLEKLKLDYEAKLKSLKAKESELDKKLSEAEHTVERRVKEMVAKITGDIPMPGPDR